MKALLVATMLVVLGLTGCATVDSDDADPIHRIRIRGLVVATGTTAPIAGATISLESDGERRSATTPANGTFALHVLPGPCLLRVQASGHAPGTFALDCSTPRHLTIRMEPVSLPAPKAPAATPPPQQVLHRLEGVVHDETAAPVAGALVSLVDDLQTIAEHRTDSSGSYAFTVPPASYTLVVGAPCAQGIAQPVSVESNMTLDVIVHGAATEPPDAPAVEAVAGPGPGQVTLRWKTPESRHAIQHYTIHRDGVPLQTIGNSLAWSASLYGQGSTHQYSVAAVDVCGNDGLLSPDVTGTPLPGDGAPIRVSTSDATGISASRSSYPVLDADGAPVRDQAWRTVTGVGNCCETYVAADAKGRIYEYGGTYILYSDDRGLTWTRVGTPFPQVGAEGAIVPAPGGDVLAFNWSPYTGDQLWVHKYVAVLDSWFYQQVPLHQPFYDRPWISVVEGPFEVGGVVAPYASLVMSNFVHGDAMLLSLDGLHYAIPSQRSLTAGSVALDWDLPPDPDRDWTQSIRESLVVPIDDGQALRGRATVYSCDWAGLTHQLMWSCPQWESLSGTMARQDGLRVDSHGHIHRLELAPGDRSMVYQVSQDGGRSWHKVVASLPDGLVAEDWDFKANGAHGMAVVAVHASQSTDASTRDQDLVFRFRGTHGSPYLHEVLEVGLGDHVFGGGLGSEYDRFDYTTVAILPDGKVALSFGDSEHTPPGIAIEM